MCSSDLKALQGKLSPEAGLFEVDVKTLLEQSACRKAISRISRRRSSVTEADVEAEIGRASCRERV